MTRAAETERAAMTRAAETDRAPRLDNPSGGA
jgi:hypothetical protein